MIDFNQPCAADFMITHTAVRNMGMINIVRAKERPIGNIQVQKIRFGSFTDREAEILYEKRVEAAQELKDKLEGELPPTNKKFNKNKV